MLSYYEVKALKKRYEQRKGKQGHTSLALMLTRMVYINIISSEHCTERRQVRVDCFLIQTFGEVLHLGHLQISGGSTIPCLRPRWIVVVNLYGIEI